MPESERSGSVERWWLCPECGQGGGRPCGCNTRRGVQRVEVVPLTTLNQERVWKLEEALERIASGDAIRSDACADDYYVHWLDCRNEARSALSQQDSDKGAEERCSECGCELDPAFAWCLGCSTTLNQRVEEPRESLRILTGAVYNYFTALALVNPGPGALSEKGRAEDKLKKAAEDARSALSQQDSK